MNRPISKSFKRVKPRISSSERPGSGFIISPVADLFFIIGAPLVTLIIGSLLFSLPTSSFTVAIHERNVDLRQVFVAVFVNAHLFLVFFRSHANPAIFRMYPFRFIAVPLGMVVLGAMSPAVLGIMGLVGIWWDVYHSSLQTFGFGRIYDSKQKNDATAGRELDYLMNLLVYLGPVLAGAHFVDHLKIGVPHLDFLAMQESSLNDLLTNRTPAYLEQHQEYLAAAILAISVPFVMYYFYAYYQLMQQGYLVSWQKVWLMVITSSVSIYCWGFHSFIDAFWVMNVFHALQYFAIVAFAEGRNLTQLFHLCRFRFGGTLAILWAISFSLLYGLWSWAFASGDWFVSMALTTSIMHYWYDGFIWSVKKKQV
jgi:hypothetical protein